MIQLTWSDQSTMFSATHKKSNTFWHISSLTDLTTLFFWWTYLWSRIFVFSWLLTSLWSLANLYFSMTHLLDIFFWTSCLACHYFFVPSVTLLFRSLDLISNQWLFWFFHDWTSVKMLNRPTPWYLQLFHSFVLVFLRRCFFRSALLRICRNSCIVVSISIIYIYIYIPYPSSCRLLLWSFQLFLPLFSNTISSFFWWRCEVPTYSFRAAVTSFLYSSLFVVRASLPLS